MSDSAKEKYQWYVSELNTRKKVLWIPRDAKNRGYAIAVLCPNCNFDPFGDNMDEKCPNCAQLLDWGDN